MEFLKTWQSKFRTCTEVWEECNTKAKEKKLTSDQEAQMDVLFKRHKSITEELKLLEERAETRRDGTLRYFFIPSYLKSNQANYMIIQRMNNNDISKPSVTIRQVAGDDQFYKTIEKELEGNGTNARKFWNLLYCEDTQRSSPRLWAIAEEGQLMGYVITFDFYQATYITCLQINEAYRGEGWGSMLLQHICKDPNRTYVLLSDVAMSDSEQLSVCVRRKMFYLKNGFRTAPVKWHSEEYYMYDVHVKGPDLELGSLLAVLRKGREIWNTAYVYDIKPMTI